MSGLASRRDALLAASRRIVVKIGTGALTGETYREIDEEVVAWVARQITGLAREGRKISLVSSGSISLGARLLGLARKDLSIPQKQAAAALGQSSLIALWGKHFGANGMRVGQVLLTHDDLQNRRRFLNSRNTLNTLLELEVTPVINENDTVAVHEIKFGDNDSLAAKVTNVMEADLLVILSDVAGLHTADPRLDPSAKRIEMVEEVDEKILSLAGDSSSMTGLGGMASKVRAAAEASRFGAATYLLPGARPDCLSAAFSGKGEGTFFFPHEDRLSSKKHWIEFSLKTKGTLMVDEGAKKALVTGGKSLLPLGVVGVEGIFESGEAVAVAMAGGEVFAKGLCNYHSHEVEKIKGKHSRMIEEILGYKMYDEIIHRDDMVFFAVK